MTHRRRVTFFKSHSVSWDQGIHLKLARWHSCMQWGWPSIREGKHLARYADYWVFTICWRTHGVVWHYYPKTMVR